MYCYYVSYFASNKKGQLWGSIITSRHSKLDKNSELTKFKKEIEEEYNLEGVVIMNFIKIKE